MTGGNPECDRRILAEKVVIQVRNGYTPGVGCHFCRLSTDCFTFLKRMVRCVIPFVESCVPVASP